MLKRKLACDDLKNDTKRRFLNPHIEYLMTKYYNTMTTIGQHNFLVLLCKKYIKQPEDRIINICKKNGLYLYKGENHEKVNHLAIAMLLTMLATFKPSLYKIFEKHVEMIHGKPDAWIFANTVRI